MEKLADTLVNHFDGIAAYCDHPVRFGVVESLNTTIKAVLRRARGMRDDAMLLLKLKWATARPIRSSRDLARFLQPQALHSNQLCRGGWGLRRGVPLSWDTRLMRPIVLSRFEVSEGTGGFGREILRSEPGLVPRSVYEVRVVNFIAQGTIEEGMLRRPLPRSPGRSSMIWTARR